MEYHRIQTACGPICGEKRERCTVYRGIPYARAERWERARLVTAWADELDGTAFRDRCCQYRGFYGVESCAINQFYYDEAVEQPPVRFSEDCLNLNIWTPDEGRDCPVLVFFHGGAFQTGGSDEPFVDGEVYTRRGILFVSANYRLGPFATAYGDGLCGNYALSDQITALNWLRANLVDYGGDPERITIMGESAGAISVQNLLIAPAARGLICGAVMLSGGGDLSCLGTPTVPQKIVPLWEKLKESFQVESLAELQRVSAASLYAAWQGVLEDLPQYAGGAAYPVVDGDLLPMNVDQALEQDALADVPCIIGVLSEDMWPYTLYTAALDYGVRRSLKAGSAPVYSYYFDRKLPGANRFGAFHGGDLWYIMGTLDRNWRPFDDVDRRISENMIEYVASFVRSGVPAVEGLAQWLPVTAQQQESLRFGDEEAAMYEVPLEQLRETQRVASVFPYK